MISISLLLITLGSIIAYLTTKKESFMFSTLLKKVKNINNKKLVISSFLLLTIALFLLIYSIGITSGILLWMFLLSTVFSLCVLIIPLKLNINKLIIGLFFISLILEYIFTCQQTLNI